MSNGAVDTLGTKFNGDTVSPKLELHYPTIDASSFPARSDKWLSQIDVCVQALCSARGRLGFKRFRRDSVYTYIFEVASIFSDLRG